MPAPALEPATTPAPAPEAVSVPTETTAREKPVSENAQATSQPVKTEAATPAADVIKQSAPVETSPAPAAEPTTEPAAQPEPQPAEAATTTNSSDTAQEEVKAPEAPAKPKPKRKGWWSN
jgi:ribonuclease E